MNINFKSGDSVIVKNDDGRFIPGTFTKYVGKFSEVTVKLGDMFNNCPDADKNNTRQIRVLMTDVKGV